MIKRPTISDLFLRLTISASLVVSGFAHAELYGRGYRSIHVIGPAFLIQAAASFGLAVVVLAGPWTLRVATGGLALGALGAFILARTTGLFGFTETGWDPAPQAAVSVIAETLTVLLCAASLLPMSRLRRADRNQVGTAGISVGARRSC
ncbi:hypothetical protein [Nocardia vaccinii]|uniref:hypothetical protein n=1 Tax=Nocardia vaccinii TaxID=1822 RepID=UPI000832F355|nr:hypothetical protein [Nocardia vaccinii]